jgi:hypothetical protein
MGAAACTPSAESSDDTLGHLLTQKGGWNEYKDPKFGDDGEVRSPASTAKLTCLAYFQLAPKGLVYNLIKVGFDPGIKKKPKDLKKYSTPGPDISAAELPDSWKVDNLTKRQFEGLVAEGVKATNKNGRPTSLAAKLKQTCQLRQGWSWSDLNVSNPMKKK